jgi:TolB protein
MIPQRMGSLLFLLLLLCTVSTRAVAQHAMTLAYQLTHVDQGEPFFSPDGSKIVYETVVAGFQQIFVMNADGRNPIQLTNDAVNHDSPAWSPDGRKIAFVSDKGGDESIWIMDSGGSNQERLTGGDHRFIHPNWSADSSRLIFCTDDDLKPPRKNASEIYTLDLKSRRLTMLISGGTNTYPSWSPDGSKIAFRKMLGEMNSEIFVASSDGSNQKNLTANPAFDGWPAWSPDGRQIAFASNRRANYQIFVMDQDGSNVRLVANTDGRATEPRWSPDGTRIYFSNCRPVDWGFDCQIFVAQLAQSVPAHP